MARTILETPGEDVGVFGGQYDIYGTTSGGEEITILTGTDVWLDPSFNTGGDTIRLPGEAEEYTAYVSGSYVILTSVVNDVTVEIPVGPNGITIVFGGDDDRTLRYDTVDGRVEIDGVAIDGTADPLPAGDDVPPTTYTVLANSPTVTEGDAGTRLLTYTITLDQPAEEDVVITYTTLAGGTAEINDDFQPVTGTVTIPAGSTTAFVSVPVFGDVLVEGNETVQLQVNSSDLVAPQTLTGTIIDDDANQTLFNLNPGSETIIGTPAPDTFRASNNELGSGDYIDGRESTDQMLLAVDQDAVNFFDFIELLDGDIDYRGFSSDNLEHYIVTNDSPYAVQLDMSGANGVTLVGTDNSSNSVRFDDVNSLADALVRDLTLVPGAGLQVFYDDDQTAGAADTVDLLIENSDVDFVTLGSIDNTGATTNTGIENLNVDVTGDSTINTLDTALTNLDIDGVGDLAINNPLVNTVRDIDATGLTGDLAIDFSNNTAGVDYDGSSGDNTVIAGDGSDNITTAEGDDWIDANGGNDVVNSNGGADTIFGDAGNDVINSGAGNDLVFGGDNDDTIDAGTGDNNVDAGSGNDFVTATTDGMTLASGNNTVDLGAGNDTATLGAGNDWVFAGSGADTISTDGGSDAAVFGGELGIEDDVDLGTGNDFLYTSAGTVDADYTNVDSAENLILQTAGVTVLGAQAQQAGIVTITGTSGNDDINAGAFTSNLTFFPGMGSDTLVSGSGDDTFNFSGDGAWDDSDIVTAGTGLDTINSTGSIHIDSANATGIDVMNFFSNGLGDAIYIHNLSALNADENGTLVLNAGALGSDDYFELIPTFWGVSPAYQLDVTGGAGGDYIEAGLNDDIVRAGAGNDTVLGLAGNDDIHLGAGDDYADGDVGADRFYGDTGADVMDLGVDADTDTVLYANLADSTFAGGDNRDTINEFDSGEDQIDIGELLARNGIAPGNTEYIYGQDLDQAEAQMVAGDGIISYVFVEEIPGDPADADTTNATGYFFVDLNDDGELGGEDLQLFVNGDDVLAGDVDVTADNLAGDSGFDIFLNDIGMAPMAKYASADFGIDTPKFEDASFA